MAVPNDPTDFTTFKRLVRNDKTRKGYIKEWNKLVEYTKISATKPATFDLYMSYLEHRREGSEGLIPLCGKSMQKLLSSLNTACQHIYRYDINKVS